MVLAPDWSRRWPWLLLSLTLVRGLLYSAVIPPWIAPDEPRHFEYARLIYENRRLVTGADLSLPVQQAIIKSMDQFDFWRFGRFVNPRFQPGSMPRSFEDIWFPGQYDPEEPNMAHQLHQPPLYYALSAAILLVLPVDDITAQLYVLRTVSVLTQVAMVGLAYWVSCVLFPKDAAMKVAIPSFVLFLPTYGYMGASVNNDRLAELVSSIAITLFVFLLARGLRPLSALALVGVLLLAPFSKRSALFTWLLAIVAGGVFMWVRPPRLGKWRHTGWVVASLAILCGLGWAVLGGQLSGGVETMYQHVVRGGPINWASVVEELRSHPTRYCWRPFRSFWGRFGWENFGFPDKWFIVTIMVSIVAGGGLILECARALRGRQTYTRVQWATAVLLASAILIVSVLNLMAAIAGNLGTKWVVFVPQGRYWFPVLIPIAVLFIMGWRAWIPHRYSGVWLSVTIFGLMTYDLAALLLVIIPHLYG